MRSRHVRRLLGGVLLPALVAAPGGAFAQSTTSTDESVIVTGTREPRKKAQDSISPVDVVTGGDILRTGQTNLTDALTQLLPSVTRPAEGIFDGAPTDFISLRGLNPSETLVLVDGKRRHDTSFIYIQGFADGATPVDVDLIPPSLIDHVEVLRDGASAEYGSDAIAGVVNIILKSSDHGGIVTGESGATGQGRRLRAAGGRRKCRASREIRLHRSRPGHPPPGPHRARRGRRPHRHAGDQDRGRSREHPVRFRRERRL